MKSVSGFVFALLVSVLLGTSANAQYGATFEGEILINGSQVSIGSRDYRWGAQTECRDAQGIRLTCETLAQVGYVDRARVVLSGNSVVGIYVVSLPQ